MDKQPSGRHSIVEPLKMMKKEAWRCTLFIGVNLGFGLLSVYVALLIPLFSSSHTFSAQILSSLKSGAFYAFVITLLSSNVVFLLQTQARRAIEHVRKWKISAITIALLLVTLIAVPAGMQAWSDATNQTLGTGAIVLQVLFAIIGTLIAIYCFLLAVYEEEFDDFAEQETAKVQELAQRSKATDDDGRGIQV